MHDFPAKFGCFSARNLPQADPYLERMTLLEPTNCVTHWAQVEDGQRFFSRKLLSNFLGHQTGGGPWYGHIKSFRSKFQFWFGWQLFKVDTLFLSPKQAVPSEATFLAGQPGLSATFCLAKMDLIVVENRPCWKSPNPFFHMWIIWLH